MKLKILLFIISIGIRVTSLRFSSFRKQLKEKNYTGLIKTRDESVARYYSFNNGKLSSKGEVCIEPSFTMVWNNADYAFKVLSSGSKIRFMKAISNGSLKVEGDPAIAIIFLETLESMGNFYKKTTESTKAA